MARVGLFILLLSLTILATGCVAFIEEPSYPAPPETAPELKSMSLSPGQIPTGSSNNQVQVALQYHDLDGDIDTSSASIEYKLTSSTYDVKGASTVSKSPESVNRNESSPIEGKIASAISIGTSDLYSPGTITVTATLQDEAGHKSNSVQSTLQVGRFTDGGGGNGGTGPGCRIEFIRSPGGPPVNSYSIGDPIYLRVEDQSFGELEPSTLFADVRNRQSGWTVNNHPLYRTGQKYVYESSGTIYATGQIGDDLVAEYTAFADPQDTCMDNAQIR